MKKCASCSKDLPEAALHCVFCGAKQAAAPAVQPGLAKTAFGYSANEVMQQLGNAQQQRPQPAPAPAYPPPPAQAYPPPPAPGYPQQPRPQNPSQPPPMGYAPGALAPQAGAHAPTMMVNPGAAPAGPPAYTPPAPSYGQQYQQPQGGYGGPTPVGTGPMGGGPQGPGGMGIHSPQVATPQPLPAAQPPPYLASQTAARAGHPIEPWRDTLRVMMFVSGAILVAVFAMPLTTDPMVFNWDTLSHAAGSAKIPPLLVAAVGLLSLVCGAIPMPTLPRGLMAAVLGFAGIFVPLVLPGGLVQGPIADNWRILLQLIGTLCLVSGLLVRNEYVDSLVARLLVTIGVVCMLVPYLAPDNGQIPLVQLFKSIVEGKNHMEIYITALVQIVLVVMCLLVWMPGPATAGANIFAWAIILWPLPVFVLDLVGKSHFEDLVTKMPGTLVQTFLPAIAYSVLVGFGVATVTGKQLE